MIIIKGCWKPNVMIESMFLKKVLLYVVILLDVKCPRNYFYVFEGFFSILKHISGYSTQEIKVDTSLLVSWLLFTDQTGKIFNAR